MFNNLQELSYFEYNCLKLQELIERYKIIRIRIDDVDKRIKEAEEHRERKTFNTGGWQRADQYVFQLYDERKQIFINIRKIEEEALKLGYDTSSF